MTTLPTNEIVTSTVAATAVALSPQKQMERQTFESEVTRIGGGLLGSKVETLLRISGTIGQQANVEAEAGVRVGIPHMNVIGTNYFDQFKTLNRIGSLPLEQMSDREISEAFLKGTLPTELVLRLYSLVERYGIPLSIRASRMNALPFSYGNTGVVHCKLIPNNQPTLEERVAVLQDAVKLIYASSFHREYRDHLSCIGEEIWGEKTAVVIQEVVGRRQGDLFYPILSGTSYSFNFFPEKRSGIYDGSVALTFGIGKGCADDVVRPWRYPLTSPAAQMPFSGSQQKLNDTQKRFFAIDMVSSSGNRWDAYEYITIGTLEQAERDPSFPLVASTYDAQNDRFIAGTGNPGARVLDFGPLLVLKTYPLNEILRCLQERIEDALYDKVAIEFAVTVDPENGELLLNVLQVTPLFVRTVQVNIDSDAIESPGTVVVSERALGNGVMCQVEDIVFVDPDTFLPAHNPQAVAEVDAINRKLIAENRRYIFIAMGRIGTTDPFGGLQVGWHQISGARVFIETDLPGVEVDFSSGSHFFSDLVSCGAFYFYTPLRGRLGLQLERLRGMERKWSGRYVTHVRSDVPLKIMVDGRTQRGMIQENPHCIPMHSNGA